MMENNNEVRIVEFYKNGKMIAWISYDTEDSYLAFYSHVTYCIIQLSPDSCLNDPENNFLYLRDAMKMNNDAKNDDFVSIACRGYDAISDSEVLILIDNIPNISRHSISIHHEKFNVTRVIYFDKIILCDKNDGDQNDCKVPDKES